MSNKNKRVYIVPKRKGIADYWHDFRTYVGNTANDIYDVYQKGTKDLDKYYVNMQGSTGGLSDEGEIYIPTYNNASDHIQKITAKNALDGSLIGLGESALLSNLLHGAIAAPLTTGAGMMLPYAVDYANQYDVFGASDNQKEMASDLSAFTPIGGVGKRFINPKTFKYNFYPKKYVNTVMRRDIAQRQLDEANAILNMPNKLAKGRKTMAKAQRKYATNVLNNTNDVSEFYLPNRLKSFVNKNNIQSLQQKLPDNLNLKELKRLNDVRNTNKGILSSANRVLNSSQDVPDALYYKAIEDVVNSSTALRTLPNPTTLKIYNVLDKAKSKISSITNKTNNNLANAQNNLDANNKIVNYIVNHPKSTAITAGMISTLPFLYPYNNTVTNSSIKAEYPTQSNTATQPQIITTVDTVNANQRDTNITNKTNNVNRNNINKNNNSKNYVTINTSKTENNKSDKNLKKQRANKTIQQAKLAQLRQAMAEANSKVLDDAVNEEYAKNGRYMNPKKYKPVYGMNDELIGFKYVKN